VKGQSKETQKARLAKGRCPVHGLPMYGVCWFENGRWLVECTRKICGFRGTVYKRFTAIRPLRECIRIMTEKRRKA
jgi:hypothetical protein